VAALQRRGARAFGPAPCHSAKLLHPGFKQLRTQFPRTELVSKLIFALLFLGLRVGLVTHARWARPNPKQLPTLSRQPCLTLALTSWILPLTGRAV